MKTIMTRSFPLPFLRRVRKGLAPRKALGLCLTLAAAVCGLLTARLPAAAQNESALLPLEPSYCTPIGTWYEYPAGEAPADPLYLTDGMRIFYDQTGVQPYLVLTDSVGAFLETEAAADGAGALTADEAVAEVFTGDGSTLTEEALQNALTDKYQRLFGTDGGHLLVLLVREALPERIGDEIAWDESILLDEEITVVLSDEDAFADETEADAAGKADADAEEETGEAAAGEAAEPCWVYYCVGRGAYAFGMNETACALLTEDIRNECLYSTEDLSVQLSIAFECGAGDIMSMPYENDEGYEDDDAYWAIIDQKSYDSSDSFEEIAAGLVPFFIALLAIGIRVYKKMGEEKTDNRKTPAKPLTVKTDAVKPPAVQQEDRRLHYPITCPGCNATAYPNKDGTCQYCGRALV
ncbi:MAG: hypothetical protein IJK40_06675 [Clostridia bacterium]|nr:hypothetical protein [Clostridia bacterium]